MKQFLFPVAVVLYLNPLFAKDPESSPLNLTKLKDVAFHHFVQEGLLKQDQFKKMKTTPVLFHEFYTSVPQDPESKTLEAYVDMSRVAVFLPQYYHAKGDGYQTAFAFSWGDTPKLAFVRVMEDYTLSLANTASIIGSRKDNVKNIQIEDLTLAIQKQFLGVVIEYAPGASYLRVYTNDFKRADNMNAAKTLMEQSGLFKEVHFSEGIPHSKKTISGTVKYIDPEDLYTQLEILKKPGLQPLNLFPSRKSRKVQQQCKDLFL